MHYSPKLPRSFVRRERSISKRIFPDNLWKRYSISTAKTIELTSYFPQNILTLDVGFGTGESLFGQAQSNPTQGYIGLEVYRTGILKLLHTLEHTPLSNVKLLEGDALVLLAQHIPPHSLDNIQILFPDPWPKSKHHKRRLIQPYFIRLLHKALKTNGRLYLATDWEHYAHHMLNTVENSLFANEAGHLQFSERPAMIPPTKFEKRGKSLGHSLFYLMFRKCP